MTNQVNVRELRTQSAAVWEALEGAGTLVVTHNGSPLAALISLDPEHVEEDLAAIRRARAQRALQVMQSNPKALTPEEIESEIHAVRKARR
jgi:antitoxin (DNA-binding transcriptional repressor) of toxin-antitoxin stability system